MSKNKLLSFIPATMEFAELLWKWRNDDETRQQSISQDPVPWESHVSWLEKTLPKNKLYVAKNQENIPVGTMRVDPSERGGVELSWTVAPEMRGKGYGESMLREFTLTLSGTIYARIRSANIASKKMAERAGFRYLETQKDIEVWSKE